MAYRAGDVFGRIPRAGKPGFSFRFQANAIIRLTNEITGAFHGGNFQRALAAAHLEAATNIQIKQVERLQQMRSKRPDVRTDHEPGALALSILDEGNRFVNASGFKVGIPSFLDKSPARRYWRQIEEGAPARTVKGWFFYPGGPTRASGGLSGAQGRFFETQGRGPVTTIGPFPAYRYGEAGIRFGRTQNMYVLYSKHLAVYNLQFLPIAKEK